MKHSENVASFTDAWIETAFSLAIRAASWSHLLQMRGLKQYGDVKKLTPLQSHLLQMRGLKQKFIGLD